MNIRPTDGPIKWCPGDSTRYVFALSPAYERHGQAMHILTVLGTESAAIELVAATFKHPAWLGAQLGGLNPWTVLAACGFLRWRGFDVPSAEECAPMLNLSRLYAGYSWDEAAERAEAA